MAPTAPRVAPLAFSIAIHFGHNKFRNPYASPRRVFNIDYDDVIAVTFTTELFSRFFFNTSFTVLIKIPNFAAWLNFGKQKRFPPKCSQYMHKICAPTVHLTKISFSERIVQIMTRRE